LKQPHALIFIYEAGVLAIDERLQVLMHEGKLLNNFFVGIEDNALKFVRDHEQDWLMHSLMNQDLRNRSPFKPLLMGVTTRFRKPMFVS